MADVNVQVLRQEELPLSNFARELVGADHGGAGVCILFVDAAPGQGPRLHRHPYEEVFITLEGEASFVADGEETQVRAGDVVIVPPTMPHSFRNSGEGRLRQIDIHLSPVFSTGWLDGESRK